jgi:hypothetical protein
MRPSCGQLIVSWILLFGGMALIGCFGHIGFLLSFPLFLSGQRIRREHDRSSLERYKQNSVCMVLVLCYYAVVLAAIGTAVARHRDPSNLNFGVQMVVFFLPFMLGMLVSDHAVCSQGVRNRGSGVSGDKSGRHL